MSEIEEIKTKSKKSTCCIIIGIFIIILILIIPIITFIMPNIITFFSNPFFWAFIGMFALIGSSATLCCKHLRKYPYLNMFFVGIFVLGRIILVLPSCPQPRFEIYGVQLIIGGLIFIIGMIFLIPLFYIKPFPAHSEEIKLVTTGFYGIVRNPIYLGEILWTLGWAIIFGSIIGVALVPLWWGGLLFHVMLEEEDLERKIGQPYRDYKSNIRGRIIPGLPM